MKCYGLLLENTPSFYVVDADQYSWGLLPDVARNLVPGDKLDLVRPSLPSFDHQSNYAQATESCRSSSLLAFAHSPHRALSR